jgi:predicted lipase
VVTGHSLGSALATLFVMENKEKNKFDLSTVCTFASPRVGNAEFVNQFNQLPPTSWRIVNTQHIVPKIPLHVRFFDYQQCPTSFPLSAK